MATNSASSEDGPTRTSDLFNAPDADVLIRSSDNVDFYLHKKNLECATGGFPPAETPSDLKDVVHLTETANILEMLFTCIYPRPFPSMDELDFDTFMLLVEAAEKYQFFSMICACRLHMKEILYPTDPDFNTNFTLQQDISIKRLQLLRFAIRHDIRDLIEELRAILVNIPLADMVEILPPHIYTPWSLYREQKLLEKLKGFKGNQELSVSKPKRPEILNIKRTNQVIMINF